MMERIKSQLKLFSAGLITVGVVLILTSIYLLFLYLRPESRVWEYQSIDTMKFSRDLARERGNDKAFVDEIEKQVRLIAESGATHVSIGTPYDEEFVPYLTKWVVAARRNNLNVWFRGNFSGWEEWFGYEKISQNEHQEKMVYFIRRNASLFADGDIFTPCPECENGGPGDPRNTKDVEGFRDFLITEHELAKREFKVLKKSVVTNFASMNFDVAKLVMDKETTSKMDGVVTIDHYVGSAEMLNSDINFIAEHSGGKVVLGEFGAPIPDIHGALSEVEQAEWLSKALDLLSKNENLIGLNYWVGFGGTTHLWKENGEKRAAADVVKRYFSPES